jgi:hypothetical protein
MAFSKCVNHEAAIVVSQHELLAVRGVRVPEAGDLSQSCIRVSSYDELLRDVDALAAQLGAQCNPCLEVELCSLQYLSLRQRRKFRHRTGCNLISFTEGFFGAGCLRSAVVSPDLGCLLALLCFGPAESQGSVIVPLQLTPCKNISMKGLSCVVPSTASFAADMKLLKSRMQHLRCSSLL